MADYRLPENIRPTRYEIVLRTDLEKETFTGTVKISVEFLKTAQCITLNVAKELVLSSESLTITSSSSALGSIIFDERSRSYDEATQRVTYALPVQFTAGTLAVLSIAFAAPLMDNLLGYYKSSWPGGIYTLTQFESTHARRAIPCWDEPLLKAVFSVTMISRAGTVSLSNTSALSNLPSNPLVLVDHFPLRVVEDLYAGVETGEWTVTTFEETPRMSSYLLAFANGAFVHRESSYSSPISGTVRPLRVYATRDIIEHTQFVLEVTARAVPMFEKVFDVEYPLSKLDTLVVHDFDINAMENWGLIIGRTSALLLDPNSQDLTRRIRIAGSLTHEISHMWFGNFTTMAWWDNLYLKEGFATVMGSSIIMNRLYPEWRPNSQFINNHLNRALRLDAKPSSHPIEVPLPDPSQINQIFDALSYAKGASILRMLAGYVGEDEFLRGVSHYLKKHSYGSTVSADLWEGVAHTTGKDISTFMRHWVASIGFPVLTVTEIEGGQAIRVRQDRFIEDGQLEEKDNQVL
ncbi:unnamed protein product [Peniophora sp. CBMAI 1063]|nr:unnamed protein product [Peniophora sp. CBMAI 1063]